MVSEAIMKIAGLENSFWRREGDGSYHNLSSLSYRVRLTTSGDATFTPFIMMHHQEHLHVYSTINSSSSKKESSGGGLHYAAPWHRDKGLFLLVTPFPGVPLLVKDRRGEMVSTEEVDQHSLLLLLGTGLSDWLLEGRETTSKFHAPSHAVPSLPSVVSHRTTVARMKVRAPASPPRTLRLVLC